MATIDERTPMSPIVAQYFVFFGFFGIHWGFLVILGTCLWFLWFFVYFHWFFGYFVDGPWHFVYSQCFFVILSMSHGLICFPKIGFVIWHWRLESWICMFFAMIENTTAANVTLAYIYIYMLYLYNFRFCIVEYFIHLFICKHIDINE